MAFHSRKIRRIPLSHLVADPERILRDCLDSGESLVVELPDHRLVAIRGLEPDEDDDLVDRLIATNSAFRERVQRSKAGPRKPFPAPGEP